MKKNIFLFFIFFFVLQTKINSNVLEFAFTLDVNLFDILFCACIKENKECQQEEQ